MTSFPVLSRCVVSKYFDLKPLGSLTCNTSASMYRLFQKCYSCTYHSHMNIHFAQIHLEVQCHRHRRTRRGSPPAWKFSGQLCFSGQAQVDQKSWMQKGYSVQWKFSGQALFFTQAQSCSKILNGKKYIRYSETFQGKQGNYRICLGYNGTSRGLHKERYCRIDVMSELKCM